MRPFLCAAVAALAFACLPAAAGVLADLQVVNRSTGERLPVYVHRGKLYVAGEPGEHYAIQVNNRTGQRILAVVSVDGVNGELELHNTNGPISVRNVTGPVSATTVNGDLEVELAGDVARRAMAFSTLNGDVVLTLPPAASFDVRMRSDNGEIYSDFDIELVRRPAEVERDSGKKAYRVKLSKELTGRIGAGGSELHLRTFNGDLVLRRRS